MTAYEKAGVDAIFMSGIKTQEQLSEVASKINVPIFLGGSAAELGALDDLAKQGVRICLQGHQPFQAAVKATYDTLKALRDGTPPSDAGTGRHDEAPDGE